MGEVHPTLQSLNSAFLLRGDPWLTSAVTLAYCYVRTGRQPHAFNPANLWADRFWLTTGQWKGCNRSCWEGFAPRPPVLSNSVGFGPMVGPWPSPPSATIQLACPPTPKGQGGKCMGPVGTCRACKMIGGIARGHGRRKKTL